MNINLDKLSGGAVAEKVNIEMQKLAQNVLDPNTKSTAKRSVTLTITVEPNEQRQVGNVDIQVTSKLAHSLGIPTTFAFDFDQDGKAVAKELIVGNDPNQLTMNNSGEVADGTGTPVNKKVVNGVFR